MDKKRIKYQSKVKKDNRVLHFDKNALWIIEITIMAFITSLVLSFFSDIVVSNASLAVCIVVLIVFIALGIVFDMIGVSATVADAKVFNSMAAKKVKGAKTALSLIKNSSKVSSFCNDVVGDICGIISGSAGVTVAVALNNMISFNPILINLIVTSIIAALTIGGKAFGKSYAINKANQILYSFAKFLRLIGFRK